MTWQHERLKFLHAKFFSLWQFSPLSFLWCLWPDGLSIGFGFANFLPLYFSLSTMHTFSTLSRSFHFYKTLVIYLPYIYLKCLALKSLILICCLFADKCTSLNEVVQWACTRCHWWDCVWLTGDVHSWNHMAATSASKNFRKCRTNLLPPCDVFQEHPLSSVCTDLIRATFEVVRALHSLNSVFLKDLHFFSVKMCVCVTAAPCTTC